MVDEVSTVGLVNYFVNFGDEVEAADQPRRAEAPCVVAIRSEVPPNCVELVLKKTDDMSAPRFLRGGSRPACFRSSHLCSLEQQFEVSTRLLLGSGIDILAGDDLSSQDVSPFSLHPFTLSHTRSLFLLFLNAASTSRTRIPL